MRGTEAGKGWRRSVRRGVAAVIFGAFGVLFAAQAAWATGYEPIIGAGSTWSANAVGQWIADVTPQGLPVDYAPTGSTDGRQQFLHGTVDFAVSDIPFRTDPDDGSAPESPAPGSYAYLPITAGGLSFVYNLSVDGHRLTNLRLSGTNIVKIFTGGITNWDDPALAADNPGIALPDESIVPVVRSDDAGTTAQLTAWMIDQHQTLWDAYCAAAGRDPSCGPTSYYPTIAGQVAESGDYGVAGYVTQAFSAGAIGYVNYSFASEAGFPVASVLNTAGYYVQPSADDVSVSLLDAVVDTVDVNDPAKYLTEELHGVYVDPDPRAYPLSSYSYMIVPTRLQGDFSPGRGVALSTFADYAVCEGQQDVATLGYAPLPINLTQAALNQIPKIPGAVATPTLADCNNPTFSADGSDLLLEQAPYPSACAEEGPIQCGSGPNPALPEGRPVFLAGSALLVAGVAWLRTRGRRLARRSR